MGKVNSGYSFWTEIPVSSMLHRGTRLRAVILPCGGVREVHLIRAGRKGLGGGLAASLC